MKRRTLALAGLAGAATIWALWPRKGAPGAGGKGQLPVWAAFHGVPLPPADAKRYNAAGKAWLDGATAKDREAARQLLVSYTPAILAGFAARSKAAAGSGDYYVREHVRWWYETDLTMANYNGQVTDQFGMHFEGTPSNLFATLAGAASYALPYVPGVGTAAAFGLGVAIAVAQGKSAKDAVLAAARTATPMPARIAFDAGVAVASGQSIDAATKNAIFAAVPGSQAAYEQGRMVAKGDYKGAAIAAAKEQVTK